MEKVVQFKKTLSLVDIVINVVIALIAISGLLTMFASGSVMMGLGTLVSAFFMWVGKVLGFGVAYCAIQVAENTAPENRQKASAGSAGFEQTATS
ncbi:hypothetical protein GZ77_01355 [Endozoicomonas montiporae]|uniref:Uncharacterized protein n=2 Tax=Endozoicomonas montiporae TaxID=1027273 RepID=A0A081NA57_9GAMM|nr:hypothetical protein [Endozoicomonas montiporae]AMO56989.1 hypothetical protein EZMO1_2950 [Endozoicomonas montiporae CL-33]KEQ15330.1 hypothetical protein GZ77_01355 [Endozoicomonas montiporae]